MRQHVISQFDNNISWELLTRPFHGIDIAVDRFISKNNQSTLFPPFTFRPETGMKLPKGVNFYCVREAKPFRPGQGPHQPKICRATASEEGIRETRNASWHSPRVSSEKSVFNPKIAFWLSIHKCRVGCRTHFRCINLFWHLHFHNSLSFFCSKSSPSHQFTKLITVA